MTATALKPKLAALGAAVWLLAILLPAHPALAAGTVSGTFTNGDSARVSAYRISDGTFAATTFMDGSGNWSMSLPETGACPDEGYKIYTEAPAGYRPQWLKSSNSYSSAECVESPSSGNDDWLYASALISGYVKDADTAADINGATVYAFTINGYFAGWATSGGAGAGRYELRLSPSQSYKILVRPGTGYDEQWYDGAPSFVAASPTVAPSTANFSLNSDARIQGYVKDAETAADIDGAIVYAYTSGGAFLTWSKSGIPGPGRYEIAAPAGTSYKLLVNAPKSHEDKWWDSGAGLVEATPVTSPADANFSLRDAAEISGTAPAGYGGSNYLSAYTNCGCETPTNAVAVSVTWHYSIKVPSTAASGQTYKIRQTMTEPDYGQSLTTWFDGADSFLTPTPNGFGDAAPVPAPATLAYRPDSEAVSLARNALTAQNVFYTDEQEFVGAGSALVAIEPAIHWTSGPPRPGPSTDVKVAITDVVGSYQPPHGSTVCITTRSETGTFFAAADIKVGQGYGTGLYYHKSSTGDPLADCSHSVIITGSTSSIEAGWP